MAQVEAPTNLDRWPNPDGRLVTLILIRCGLRASDACMLAFDCLLHDGQGAPYLRYFNHKMHREAAVPLDEELEAEIRAQQRRVTQRWPDDHPHLFPGRKRNAGGHRSLTYYSYRISLNRWLATCDIRDEHGQPARLTPHQWRHTFVISPALNRLRDVGCGGGRARALRVSRSCRYRWLPSPRDPVDQCGVPGRAGGVAARRRRVVGGPRR